jgi:hypothetical protein
MSTRNAEKPCDECKAGTLIRTDAGRGLPFASAPSRLSLPSGRPPGVVIRNITVAHCGTGIKMEGGARAYIDGYTAINTQPAFDLSDGACVDARNVVQITGEKSGARKRRGKRSR